MNSLSWLIYAIHLFGNLGGFFLGVAIVSSIALAIVTLIRAINNSDRYCYGGNAKEKEALELDKKEVYKNLRVTFLKWVCVPVLCFFIAAIIPDRRTMYLIAASEIGERVVQSEKVQSVFDPSIDLLKNWIKSENDKIVESMKPTEKK